jgi:hypothetical protein
LGAVPTDISVPTDSKNMFVGGIIVIKTLWRVLHSGLWHRIVR